MNESEDQAGKTDNPARRGFLNSGIVKAVTFYTIALCILASVILCILAIWEFADTDVFWRMLATFFVIAFGSGVFAVINHLFGSKE